MEELPQLIDYIPSIGSMSRKGISSNFEGIPRYLDSQNRSRMHP